MEAEVPQCSVCKDNFIINNKTIGCGFCKNRFHNMCIKIKDNFSKSVNDASDVFWFCGQCIEIVKQNLGLIEDISTIKKSAVAAERRLEDCLKAIEEIKKQLPIKNEINPHIISESVNKNEVMSYRDAASVQRKEVIVVKPKGKKTHQEVKKDLVNKVDPIKMKMNVKFGKNLSNGGVIIECPEEETPENVRKEIEKNVGSEYEVKLPKKTYPKMKIINISSDINRDCNLIREKLIMQNNIDINGENFHLDVFYLTQEHKGYYNALIETDMRTFEGLRQRGKVFISLHACRVFEFVNVAKCYKCQGFNHFSRECEEENTSCPICSKNHSGAECKEKNESCINCLRANKKYGTNLSTNHTVWDRACKCLQRAEEQMKSKLNYNK